MSLLIPRRTLLKRAALAAPALVLARPSLAQLMMMGVGKGSQGAGAVASPFVFRDQQHTTTGGNPATYSVDIGTASADRLVIVAVMWQSGSTHTITALTVNGTALTADVTTTPSDGAAIYSGLVTSGDGVQTISLTVTSGVFTSRDIAVWTATGLASNVHKQVASGTSSASISVSAGDYLVAATAKLNFAGNFNASTETPRAQRNTSYGGTAEWVVASTNAAFSVSPALSSAVVAAAFA